MSEFDKILTEEEVVVEDNESELSDTNNQSTTEESLQEVATETEEVSEPQQEETVVQKGVQAVKEKLQTIDAKDIKHHLANFGQYFGQCIKQPDSHLSTPIISYHVIIGLLFVLSSILFGTTSARDILFFTFGAVFSMTENFGVIILSKIVHLSVILLIMVAVTTVVQKNFLSRDVTFRSVLAEFTSRLALPTVILFIAGVLAYVDLLPGNTRDLIMYQQLIVLFLLPILSITMSKKRHEEVEMPTFYATVLTLFLIFVTLYVVYRVVI